MDSRVDFQRLVESFDQMIEAKKQELMELDERLETARGRLSEKEAKELRKENSAILSQIEDESMALDNVITKQQLDKFMENQKFYYEQQLENITNLMGQYEDDNKRLIEDNQEFKRRISRLSAINVKLTSDYERILNELDELKGANFDLNMRLAKTENESQIQQKLLKRTHQEDEVLMDAFKEKMESLKRAIEDRDNEIQRLVLQLNDKTKKSTDNEANTYVSKKSNLIASDIEGPIDIDLLIETLKQRDEQIEILKGNLSKASKNLKKSSFIIDEIIANKSISNELPETLQLLIRDYQIKSESRSPHLIAGDGSGFRLEQALASKCQSLEIEIEAKDKQLFQVVERNHELERILPDEIMSISHNLSIMLDKNNKITEDSGDKNLKLISQLHNQLESLLDCHRIVQLLLERNEQLKALLLKRDQKIKSYSKQLSYYHAKLNDDSDLELDSKDLKAMDDDHDVVELNDKKTMPIKSPNSEDSSSKDTVILAECYDDGRNSSLDKDDGNGKRMQHDNETDAASFTANNEEIIKSDQAGEILHNEFNSQAEDKTIKKTLQNIDTNNENTARDEDKTRLVAKIYELEREIELFELAMREILLSIKWTDSQCGMLSLDCPSLERFCQLIESRFLATKPLQLALSTAKISSDTNDNLANPLHLDGSGYLFQMLIMKSELDLVRGQNEQLRTDLKIERNDYIERMNSLKKNLELEINDNLMKDKRSLNEVECQTETSVELKITSINDSDNDPRRLPNNSTVSSREGCKNCAKLRQLSSHLMQAIIRIEEKVNSSDETYEYRLKYLHEHNQKLQSDLISKDMQLHDIQQKYHLLSQQKTSLEITLRNLKTTYQNQQINCRLNGHDSFESNIKDRNMSDDFKYKTINTLTTINNHHHVKPIQKVPISRPLEMPITGNPKMTISLLQSIIKCLQARLDHKEVCLQNMENLISRFHDYSSSNSDTN